MKKLLLAAAIAAPLSGCITLGQAITAADIGLQIARSVKQARDTHPEDFEARKAFYAEMYCEFRDARQLQWDSVRAAAIKHGAPEVVVDDVKLLIDLKCGGTI